MRVAYISDTTYWRAGGRWHTVIPWPVELMANALGAASIEFVGRVVEVGVGASLPTATSSGCEIAVTGVAVRRRGPAGYARVMGSARATVAAAVSRADVIYVQPGVLSFLAEKRLRAGPFLLYHQVGELTKGLRSIYPAFATAGRLLERSASRLRARADVAAFVSKDLARKYGGDRDNVRVVNESRVRELDIVRDRPAEPSCQPTVLYVGRLSREKGIDLLPQICQRVPYRLRVVGDGPERDDLARQLARHGDRAELAGRVPWGPKLFNVMRAADVLILPSLTEGLPLVLIEAMSQGTPCVASDVGGVGEVLTHGENGFLIGTRNPDDWAEAIIRAIEDHGFRQRAIVRSLEVARSNTVEQQLGSLLDEVRLRVTDAHN